jgi:hypothetical protein
MQEFMIGFLVAFITFSSAYAADWRGTQVRPVPIRFEISNYNQSIGGETIYFRDSNNKISSGTRWYGKKQFNLSNGPIWKITIDSRSVQQNDFRVFKKNSNGGPLLSVTRLSFRSEEAFLAFNEYALSRGLNVGAYYADGSITLNDLGTSSLALMLGFLKEHNFIVEHLAMSLAKSLGLYDSKWLLGELKEQYCHLITMVGNYSEKAISEKVDYIINIFNKGASVTFTYNENSDYIQSIKALNEGHIEFIKYINEYIRINDFEFMRKRGRDINNLLIDKINALEIQYEVIYPGREL